MNDYLEIYEKFKDVKDIQDYIDDVQKLREYYRTGQLQKMLEHITMLTIKYLAETVAWNIRNPQQPITCEQAYINAEDFLCAQGTKIIINSVKNYAQRLDEDEKAFVELLSRQWE